MSALALCVLASTFLPILAEDTETPDVDRPQVSFTPDWRTMFYNETLTISCLHPSNVQQNETYTWYRSNIQMDITSQNFTISSIQLYDRANYQCQTRTSVKSDPIRPHVITDLTILRVPRYVFEGDILNITCDSRLDVNTTNAKVSFTKNYELVKPMNYDTYLFVGRVDRTVAGKHSCTKKAIFKTEVKETDAEEMIEVTALFPPPEIKISMSPISVGMVMTLTCVTSLHPFRADTELQFAFYRNGWHVQGFGPSKKYTVQSVELGDSGDYSCEVRTIMNSVKKMSKLLPVIIQESIKPVLSFSPNWDKIMRNDQVTLTCDKKSRRYSWYKDNVKLFVFGSTLKVYASTDRDIGHYQCQGESGERSDRVHLDIFFVWLILQAPLSIHEGDIVTLRCRMWVSGSAVNTTFYKDENMIQFLGSDTDLSLGAVSKNATGKYKCTRFINTGSISKTYVAEEYISVAELFTTPDIRLNVNPVVEGADMTLACHTTISPLRQSIGLKFSFYKNGKIVQNFSESRKYKISSAQLEDSGSYACEVRTSSNTVKKMSPAISINVQGMAVVSFLPNVGKILTTETMTLTCNVDPKIKEKQEYYWYKDGNQVNITQQSFTIQDAHVSDSGYYQCRSTNTHMSEPIRLDVSNSDLIVQAPPFILEGDDLNLTCHFRRGLDSQRTNFYKNGNLLKLLGSNSVLQLGKAYSNMSGEYKCTKDPGLASFRPKMYSSELFVSVSEIFSYLVVKVKTSPIIDGDPITLICDVALNSALNPLRGSTNLEFAFYKDGNKIQEFGKTNMYPIQAAKKSDSGNYTCYVRSSLINEVKISQALEVNVQELFSTPTLTVSPENIQMGNPMAISCDYTVHPDREGSYVKTTIYKNGKVLTKSRAARYFSARSDHSGDYMCEVTDPTRTIITYSKTRHILVEEQVAGVKLFSEQREQHDMKMFSGSNITFTCSVSEGTSFSFTWLHNFQEIGQSCASHQVLHNGQTLFIGSVQTYHSGSYQCKASNHFSSSESNKLELTVIEPIGDAYLRTDQKVLDVVKEDNFTFTCSLTRGNGSHFSWIHNEYHVEEEDASIYELRQGGKVLHIKSVQPHHEGSYQCIVETQLSPTRGLFSPSDTLTLKISSKGGSYLKPLLIIMAVLTILFISLIVYKYQNKLVKPHFLQAKSETTRVPLEIIGDKVLLVDNMENSERTPNSLH